MTRPRQSARWSRISFKSRMENGAGTNPEELIGAAHAGCYSMFLSALLTKAGFTPTRISTTATVHLTDGPTISLIELHTEAEVPGLSDASPAAGGGTGADAARSCADLCREAPSKACLGTLRATSKPDDTRRTDVSCHTADPGSLCCEP